MSVNVDAGDKLAGYMGTFSYLTSMLGDDFGPEAKGTLCGLTVMNALGCIPGVSLIVGIARIILSQVSGIFDLEGKSNKGQVAAVVLQEAQLVRGVLECCTVLAPLILLADVITTLFFLTIILVSS